MVDTMPQAAAQPAIPATTNSGITLVRNSTTICSNETAAGLVPAACLTRVSLGHCLPARDERTQWMRCWLASHDTILGASRSFQLLSFRREVQGRRNLPEAEALLAAPKRCYSFATTTSLREDAPDPQAGATMKETLIATRRYPQNASTTSVLRLVLLEAGACLPLFFNGIPQLVRDAQIGVTATGRPLLSEVSYARIIPSFSRAAERALFRSTYPDPILLKELEEEASATPQSHYEPHEVVRGRGGSESLPAAPFSGLRRPALIVSTLHRYQAAATEVWAAGFEPVFQPAIYANTSQCHPNGPNSRDPEARFKVKMENVVEAFRGAGRLVSSHDVPYAIFEDDVRLASSRMGLHRYLDKYGELDFVALGACSTDEKKGFMCGHATYSSPSVTRLYEAHTEDCHTRSLNGIDTYFVRHFCRTKRNRCADWRSLRWVPLEHLWQRFPNTTTAAVRGAGVISWVWSPEGIQNEPNTSAPPSRFIGYGYFVQDRVAVTPTLHSRQFRPIVR